MPMGSQQLMGVRGKLQALIDQGVPVEAISQAAQAYQRDRSIPLRPGPSAGTIFSDRADIYDKFAKGTNQAYEASQVPYEESTLDKIMKWGGLGLGALGVLGVGGKKTSNAMAGLGGAALGRRMGAPERDRATKTATLDNALAQLAASGDAALGANKALGAGYLDEYGRWQDAQTQGNLMQGRDIQQDQFDRSLAETKRYHDASLAAKSAPSETDLRGARKEHASVWNTGGEQGGQGFTEPARASILAEVAAREPDWMRSITHYKDGKPTGVKPTFKQAQDAYAAGEIGNVPEDDQNNMWWPPTWGDPTIPAHKNVGLQRMFEQDYPQAEADSAAHQLAYARQHSPFDITTPQQGGLSPDLIARGVTTPQAAITYLQSLNLTQAEYNQALKDNGLAR